MGTHYYILIFFVSRLLCSSSYENHKNWRHLPTEHCGFGGFEDRIVGGFEVSLGKYPWMARIGYRNNSIAYNCAGTIISQWFILTAAHCLFNDLGETIYSVVVGENFIDQEIDCEDSICALPPQHIKVKGFRRYEHFSPQTYSGDVGIVELYLPIRYNDFVSPICLPPFGLTAVVEKQIKKGASFEAAGWGYLNSTTRTLPDKLMAVQIPITNMYKCKFFYYEGLDDRHICAGVGFGKDTCTGDSGGPLMKELAFHDVPKYYLIGVVSFGMSICGTSPALYANVTHYMEWILDSIHK